MAAEASVHELQKAAGRAGRRQRGEDGAPVEFGPTARRFPRLCSCATCLAPLARSGGVFLAGVWCVRRRERTYAKRRPKCNRTRRGRWGRGTTAWRLDFRGHGATGARQRERVPPRLETAGTCPRRLDSPRPPVSSGAAVLPRGQRTWAPSTRPVLLRLPFPAAGKKYVF